MCEIQIDLVIPIGGFSLKDNNKILDCDYFLSVTFNVPIDEKLFEHLRSKLNPNELSYQSIENNAIEIIDEEPELVSKSKTLLEKNGAELCPEGVGGTYFIKDDEGKIYSVFKPVDEEPGAEKNPKDLMDDPLLIPGGGAKRELAAYVLDEGHAGVPETYLSKFKSNSFSGEVIEKEGSLQKYIENIGNSSTIGTSLFPVEDVHNIGILDIRLLNMDRNDENILVTKQGDKHNLVPIDHTYSLPPTLDNIFFEWMHWKQAKEAFSPKNLAYIESLDPLSDAEKLRQIFGIEEESIKNMIYSTLLLKKASKMGKNLHEIAAFVCRKKFNEMSLLEEWIEMSEKEENKLEKFEEIVVNALKTSNPK